ncbi:aquaporin-11 isoform X2 [Sorex araneus]|uniref:aquaporin-11 isoform X2 n=1 Tax=Sorex araneus TaxID=42254 RepID=UPI002433A6E8|nr:aquaporin-11 isoform X2 [Sorex araneus]
MAMPAFWLEVRDTCTSMGLMMSVVLLVGAARVYVRQHVQRAALHAFLLELLATFQLCLCTHELQLLSEQEPPHSSWPLTLIYFFSLVHGLTLAGTSNNPCGLLMQMLLGAMTPSIGLLKLGAQLIGALSSKLCVVGLWNLELARFHDSDRSFVCRSPIQVDLAKAFFVESLCSFIFHSALLHFQEVRATLRIHLLSALITFLVYAGGSLTGAVFNPALALSLHFKCFGEAFFQFLMIYWLAPCLVLPWPTYASLLALLRIEHDGRAQKSALGLQAAH